MSQPGQGTSETYSSESILAGENVHIIDREFAADTYVRGQIVGLVVATGVYTKYVAAGSGGAELAKAVVAKDITIGAAGSVPIFKGSFQLQGVQAVMSALSVPVTISNKMIGELDDAGCFMKRA